MKADRDDFYKVAKELGYDDENPHGNINSNNKNLKIQIGDSTYMAEPNIIDLEEGYMSTTIQNGVSDDTNKEWKGGELSLYTNAFDPDDDKIRVVGDVGYGNYELGNADEIELLINESD